MKKKIIALLAVLVILLAAFTGGILWLLKDDTVATGNKLDVAWYDEGGTEFTIFTADELYEFAALSSFYNFRDQTIKLGADIVINEGNAQDWAENAPARRWVPISGFAGTFDGQGHTISGIYETGYDAPVAMFCDTMSSGVIQNFKLVNSYFKTDGKGGTGSISSGGGGIFKRVYSNAILECEGMYTGGIAGKLNLNATFEECWFDGTITANERGVGGIVGTILGSQVSMDHCLFTGEINQLYVEAGTQTGGLCGVVNLSGAGLDMNDSLATGVINADNVYYTGSVLGASYANTGLEVLDSYGSLITYSSAIGQSGENGNISGRPLYIANDFLIGEKAYQWTNLDFKNYWTIVEGGTPILQCFADKTLSVDGIERAFDLSWYDKSKTEFVITNLKELYGFYMISAADDFKGKTVKLGADIVVNEGNAADWAANPENAPENPWTPINKFNGTFDGQGYTVSGIYFRTSAQLSGFFKETAVGSTIKNFNLKNSYFLYEGGSGAIMGSVAGRGNGTYDTIYSNAILVSNGTAIGGIVGQINNNQTKNTVTNCWFDGTVALKEQTGRYGGGIAGTVVRGATSIENCLNTGTISSEVNTQGVMIGGIVGYVVNAGTVLTIQDCLNVGAIKNDYHICVGAVIGRIPSGTEVAILNTYATIESYQHPTSGFLGVGSNSINTYVGGVIEYYAEDITGYGGYQRTTLDFNNYWAVDRQSTPILKSFAGSVPSLSGVKRLVNTDWYKEDAKTLTINTAEELRGFYLISAIDTLEGKTVRLGKDISLNSGNASTWGTTAPGEKWFPLKAFSGTFDGQGHTISGIYTNVNYGYVGMFSKVNEEAVIKNFRLENSYLRSTADAAYLGSIAGQFGGTLDTVYSSAIVEGNGTQIGGLVGRIAPSVSKFKAVYRITDCWFDGEVNVSSEIAAASYIGGIAGSLVQGTLNMDNCLNTGTVTYLYDDFPVRSNGETWYLAVYTGGLVGGVMNGLQYNADGSVKMISEWNVSDTLSAGLLVSGLRDGSRPANGTGAIWGYTTSGTINMKNVYMTTDSHSRAFHSSSAPRTGNVITCDAETIFGLGGYSNTVLDFQNYWAARAAKVPALKKFVPANAQLSLANAWRPDTSWYNESKDSFTISTVGELYGLASLVNNGTAFAGKTVKLGANIDVNPGWTAGEGKPENVWTPIGSNTAPTSGKTGACFEGNFNGNGKTISGIYVKDYTTSAGLFGYVSDSRIENFRLVNSYLSSTGTALGSIVGYGDGTLENIYTDAILYSTGAQVGGFVGRVQDKNADGATASNAATLLKITDCWFDGTIKLEKKTDATANNNRAFTGGFVGLAIYGTVNLDSCLYTGTIEATYSGSNVSSANLCIGGLVGSDSGGLEVTVSNTISAGEIKVTVPATTVTNVGSIMGYVAKTLTMSKNIYATSDCHSTQVGNKAASTFPGLTVTKSDNLKGILGYENTELDFDTVWSARADEVPALRYFYGEGLDLSNAHRKVTKDTSWYDDAKDEFVISTPAELLGFASLVNEGKTFAGKKVKLGGDIDMNPGWIAGEREPQNVWIPIGSNTAPTSGKGGAFFEGDFDGDGKTISGIYVSDYATSAGLFGYVSDSTIENFRLVNSYFNFTATAMGGIVGYGDGTLRNIYTDAIIHSTGSQVGGFFGRVQDKNANGATDSNEATLLELNNCWFDGMIEIEKAINATANNNRVWTGGFVGYVQYGNVNMDNCLYTGTIKATYSGSNVSSANLCIGGMVGSDGAGVKVTISNSISAGEFDLTVPATTVTNVGSVMGYAAKALDVSRNVYVTEESYSAQVGNVTPAGLNVKKMDDLIGVLGYANTELDFDTYWSAREEEVPALKYFYGEGLDVSNVNRKVTKDTSWYDDAKNEFTIRTPAEFFGFASLVNEGKTFAGKKVKLGGNINLNPGWVAGEGKPENVWIPIGSNTAPTSGKGGAFFEGDFDGDGKTISGIYVSDYATSAGLFGYISDSTIENFRLVNSYFNFTATAMGGIVGYGDGTLRNIYTDALIHSNGSQVGGFIGRVQDKNASGATDSNVATLCEIQNCWFDGTIEIEKAINATANNNRVWTGGFVGYVQYGSVNMDNCLYTGTIKATYSGSNVSSANLCIGGMVGSDGAGVKVTIANSISAGVFDLTVPATTITNVGSVMGYAAKTLDVSKNVYTTEESYSAQVGNKALSALTDLNVMAKNKLTGDAWMENTELDSNVWVSRDADNVPALQAFANGEVDKTVLARANLLNMFAMVESKKEEAEQNAVTVMPQTMPAESSFATALEADPVRPSLWISKDYLLMMELWNKIARN